MYIRTQKLKNLQGLQHVISFEINEIAKVYVKLQYKIKDEIWRNLVFN